jgi:hypothetical protein
MIEYENLVNSRNVQMSELEVAVVRATHNYFHAPGQGASIFENEFAKCIGAKYCIDAVNDLDTSIRAIRKFLNNAMPRLFYSA